MTEEYETELSELGSSFERATKQCPACPGVVKEPRSGDKWLCGTCARRWSNSEI